MMKQKFAAIILGLSLAFGGTLAVGSTLLGGAPALAQGVQTGNAKSIVDGAIAKGEIGETAGGYLAAVNGAKVSSSVKAAMDEINIGRKSVYTRLAREQNVTVEVVAALTGEKQIAKAKPGSKVLNKDGKWVTK